MRATPDLGYLEVTTAPTRARFEQALPSASHAERHRTVDRLLTQEARRARAVLQRDDPQRDITLTPIEVRLMWRRGDPDPTLRTVKQVAIETFGGPAK